MNDNQKSDLLSKVKPVAFTDGTDIFKEFMDEYNVHDKGLFILAPSGAGKTHYIKNQTHKDWIDGDELWIAAGAHPDEAWWTMGWEHILEVDQRSDVITMYAKKLGLWILGTNQYWLKPDAIILPNWEKHKEYISFRENNNYDGGAKSDALDQVLKHRGYMEDLAERENIPIFQSVEEAVVALTKSNG